MKALIDITNEQIQVLKNFLSKIKVESKIDKELNMLSDLLNSLELGIEITSTTEELAEENKRLEGVIAGLKFQLGIKVARLSTTGNLMGAVAADLLINPNPVLIHGTEAGKG